MGSQKKTASRQRTVWEKQRDSLKTRWVISVMAFWVSTAILAVAFYLKNELDLILTSISLGLMIIGLWLKTRYQLHLRNAPPPPGAEAE